MLVTAKYTEEQTNERFDRLVRQSIQSLVLPRKSGIQFVDQVKVTVKQIGEHYIEEKQTDNAIVALIKPAIEIKYNAIIAVIELAIEI